MAKTHFFKGIGGYFTIISPQPQEDRFLKRLLLALGKSFYMFIFKNAKKHFLLLTLSENRVESKL